MKYLHKTLFCQFRSKADPEPPEAADKLEDGPGILLLLLEVAIAEDDVEDNQVWKNRDQEKTTVLIELRTELNVSI